MELSKINLLDLSNPPQTKVLCGLVSSSLVIFIVVLAVSWLLLWIRFRGSSGRVKVYPLLLIVRTGLKGEPLGGSLGRILSLLGWPSVAVMILSAIGFYYLALNLFIRRYIAQPEPGPGASTEGFVPLLPGITIPLDENLLIILVAIGLAVLVHEVSHAMIARAVGVKVKDAGFILLAFIPGAFIEPDEDELRGAPLTSRLKVYSAGVAANIALALLALLALVTLSPTLYNGVLVLDVDEGAPASLGGLREGMVIVEVNGVPTRTVDDFIRVLRELGVADKSKAVILEVRVLGGDGEKILTIRKPEGWDRIGVRVAQNLEWAPLASLLQALFMVNLALALVNAAPLVIPTPAGSLASDGAHFLGDLVARVLGERAKLLVTPAIGLATLLLIVSLITLTPVRFTP